MGDEQNEPSQVSTTTTLCPIWRRSFRMRKESCLELFPLLFGEGIGMGGLCVGYAFELEGPVDRQASLYLSK